MALLIEVDISNKEYGSLTEVERTSLDRIINEANNKGLNVKLEIGGSK